MRVDYQEAKLLKDGTLYKVSFINQNNVYEVFARQVYESDLYGFVVIEELVFGNRTTVVVDPNEEKLKSEFEAVRRSYIPMHAIIRIDEVEKQGTSKIKDVEGNIAAFPMPAKPGQSAD